MQARLDQLNVPFERFDAVDGRQTPHPLFAKYCDRLRRRYRRTVMSGGELGCFASHYLLWQRCVELDEPIVVMEDDVVIDDSFVEALQEAKKCIGTFPYIRLAGTSLRKAPYEILGKVGAFDLTDHVRGPTGTLCYVIHPSAAQRMIAASDQWYLAVDDQLDRYWIHGIDCMSLMPFPVRVGQNPSDIQRKPKDRRIVSVLLRECFRRLEIIRRDRYRRKIAVDKAKRVAQFFAMRSEGLSMPSDKESPVGVNHGH